jgi:hypothetical protein
MPKPVMRTLLLMSTALLASLTSVSALGAYAWAEESAGRAADGASTVLLGDGVAVGSRSDRLDSGEAQAFRLRTRTSGVTDLARLYLDSGGTASAVVVGVYNNAGGRPGSLLSEGSGSSLRGRAWNTVAITPTRLIAGRAYWLAVLGVGGTLRYLGSADKPCLRATSTRADLRGLPGHWRTGGVRARANCPISAYVLAAGPTPSLPPAASAASPAASAPSPPANLPPATPILPAKPTSPANPEQPIERKPTEESSQPHEEPSPPPPVNKSLPAISGSTIEGETLKTNTGKWSNDPTSYAYQWESCDALGEACLDVQGATAPSYELTASDVMGTMRVVVNASNSGGSTPARSKATAAIEPEPEPEPEEGRPKHCFENPEYEGTTRIESCGYPGPHNVGVETSGKKCSELASSGHIEPSAGATIENKDITGGVIVKGSNVKLIHDCVASKGRTGAVTVECGAENFRIENSDIRGENDTTGADNVAIEDNCAWEGNKQMGVAKKDAMWFCSSCVLGNWEVDESYVLANAGIVNGNQEGWHNEDVYINSSGGHGGLAIDNDDTMLNPDAETAIVFGDTNTGAGGEQCSDKLRLTNSLLAGSGAMFQICGGGRATSRGTGEIIVKTDRFARCVKNIEGSPARCRIPSAWRTQGGSEAAIYGEEYGYFPDGAANDELLGCTPACPTGAAFAWEGNYWDNNLALIAE